MYFCMIEEPVGIKYRHDFRVDRILWESDYPHADTPFPKTQHAAKQVFDGISQEEIDLITHKTPKSYSASRSRRNWPTHTPDHPSDR